MRLLMGVVVLNFALTAFGQEYPDAPTGFDD